MGKVTKDIYYCDICQHEIMPDQVAIIVKGNVSVAPPEDEKGKRAEGGLIGDNFPRVLPNDRALGPRELVGETVMHVMCFFKAMGYWVVLSDGLETHAINRMLPTFHKSQLRERNKEEVPF